jgi:nicotinamidase
MYTCRRRPPQGTHPLIDGYSAFAMNHYVQFSALPRLLFARGVTKLTVVGLAADWCVKFSVSEHPYI